ncbi:prenylated rab acceptor PRA1 [Mycena olivaceomarginata]|uniref:PRA1 family protein n=1 Tax=Mycena albidolilacea TaxID=1033008 RepID=A0AAD7A035_9AGAR|nr:prenylated rab acceptor PRA1 [Mycena albidolilacea]KAJ7902085.1 prenylated rab acceptor PRA1 [Mycena olivaceomarginata]
MEALMRVTDTLKSFREARLSGLRSPVEFFDVQRISRPADMNTATSRISYNTRYFSGNYGLIVVILAIYALLSNQWLFFTLIFLVGGFSLINKFAPEPTQVGDYVVTQKSLYITLFCIGIPLLIFSGPFGTLFWLIGASGLVIIGHAVMIEPGVESEYATVEGQV